MFLHLAQNRLAAFPFAALRASGCLPGVLRALDLRGNLGAGLDSSPEATQAQAELVKPWAFGGAGGGVRSGALEETPPVGGESAGSAAVGDAVVVPEQDTAPRRGSKAPGASSVGQGQGAGGNPPEPPLEPTAWPPEPEPPRSMELVSPHHE